MSDLTKRLLTEENRHIIGYPGPRRDVAELLRAAREEIDRLTRELAEARDKALEEVQTEIAGQWGNDRGIEYAKGWNAAISQTVKTVEEARALKEKP